MVNILPLFYYSNYDTDFKTKKQCNSAGYKAVFLALLMVQELQALVMVSYESTYSGGAWAAQAQGVAKKVQGIIYVAYSREHPTGDH